MRWGLLAIPMVCACSSFGSTEEGATTGDAGVSGSPAGPRSGLVLALDFEDASEVNAADTSGKKNDASVFNATHVPGVHGNAIHFTEGTPNGNVSVNVPSSPSLDIAGTELTIAFWIDIAQPVPLRDQVVFGKFWTEGAMPVPWYQYGVELIGAAKQLSFFVGEPNVADARVTVAPAFGTWTHIAFVVGGGKATSYLNGVPSQSNDMPASITKRGTSLALGVDALGEQQFVGAMDEVRVYDRALGADEIAQLAAR